MKTKIFLLTAVLAMGAARSGAEPLIDSEFSAGSQPTVPPEKIDASNLFCSHIDVKATYYDNPQRNCPAPSGAADVGFCHEETECTILPASDKRQYASLWRKKPGRTAEELKLSDQQIFAGLAGKDRDEFIALFKSNKTYANESGAWFKSTLVCEAERTADGKKAHICPAPQKCALNVYYAPETDVAMSAPDADNAKSFMPMSPESKSPESNSGAAK